MFSIGGNKLWKKGFDFSGFISWDRSKIGREVTVNVNSLEDCIRTFSLQQLGAPVTGSVLQGRWYEGAVEKLPV